MIPLRQHVLQHGALAVAAGASALPFAVSGAHSRAWAPLALGLALVLARVPLARGSRNRPVAIRAARTPYPHHASVTRPGHRSPR
ncbi:hypothetical protein [Streptomyces sp. 8N616]|uniref:hypothetical protein n=1 Tax=Streptomyces sp. 8N616 TaxID=3457414 RepID=UPI003FCFE3A5